MGAIRARAWTGVTISWLGLGLGTCQCRSVSSRSTDAAAESTDSTYEPAHVGFTSLESGIDLEDGKARDLLALRCESCHTGEHTNSWTLPLAAFDFKAAMATDPLLPKVRSSIIAYLNGSLGAMPPNGGGEISSADRNEFMGLVVWMDRLPKEK